VHESTVMEGRGGHDRPMLNVHGHIHQNLAPSKFHYNACVEMNNYTPINIEDLAKIARKL